MVKKFCCPNCFSDYFLKEHIPAVSNKEGKCSFCNSLNVVLIDPEFLFDRFEPLLELYEADSKGNKISELIQSDWNVFSFASGTKQNNLLKAITKTNYDTKSKFKPKYLQDRTNIEQWEKFREELKHSNRFFPNAAPSRDQLNPFGKYIGSSIKSGAQVFYRARINNSDNPHPIKKMGKPPEKEVGNGRANPNGIPYLYVSSTIDTAISEVRGHKGEELTVAEFHLKSNIKLADLREPKNKISPFLLNDEENELELIYKNMPFLTLLGNELSKPIIPREANLEYLPSQYLCELVKHMGFNGIIFKSSISDGNNYVIFSDKKLKAMKTFQYHITDTSVSAERID